MRRARRRLTIAVIAPLRHPIREPHAGGLEASVWDRVRILRARGHRVLLCAVEGSDYLTGGPDEFVLPAAVWADESEATDTSYPPGHLARALSALDDALARIASGTAGFDIVDNHSLHGGPLVAAAGLGVPMLTTLHTPPLPDMLAAHRIAGPTGSSFAAVSSHTAAEWALEGIHARVLPNAVDADRWVLGAGGDDLVWFGRIVPEKGTHLAIEAARLTGRRLRIAGRIGDADYFDDMIAPRLGADVDYVGALRQPELADLVGSSACALVTPLWEEPFGMVVPEALATGTPVAAFAAGGVAEVVGRSRACALVPMGDAAALAEAAEHLASSPASIGRRRRIRESALRRFSIERRAAELEDLFVSLIDESSSRSSLTGAAPRSAADRRAVVDA